MECSHPNIVCLNPYELIRKYHCETCGEVMMCECEKEFAEKHLPHQISSGTELKSKKEYRVTLGFVARICNKCRGLQEVSTPMAAIYGRTSRIKRYYWREIAFETIKRLHQWSTDNGFADGVIPNSKYYDLYEQFEKEATDVIKDQHTKNPKYIYAKEESFDDIVKAHNIVVVRLDGKYGEPGNNRARIKLDDVVYGVEEFVIHHFKSLGYKAIKMESVPFHVLFGTFMWQLIQHPGDPNNRLVSFGNRDEFSKGLPPTLIMTLLPSDFGSSGYSERRSVEIARHFEFIRNSGEDLHWLFDYWTGHSHDFRQYLWAHEPKDIQTAKHIIDVLPLEVIIRILDYLVESYWEHFLGWPDLLVYDDNEYFFAEVKSSSDSLSDDQKDWIRGNSKSLHLPFKIVKVHKLRS